jgi:hypothetical protein
MSGFAGSDWNPPKLDMQGRIHGAIQKQKANRCTMLVFTYSVSPVFSGGMK